MYCILAVVMGCVAKRGDADVGTGLLYDPLIMAHISIWSPIVLCGRCVCVFMCVGKVGVDVNRFT